ncbi:MAG TPA: ester cyclase [Vicinamibacterales bacterium]|nr:ester cyclase [Vicinamibacterales bacterium]
MTRTAIEERLSEHKAAFARRDVEALASAHAQDGTFESPAVGVVRGRDAIRDVYRYWYTAFPDFLLSWEVALVDPPRASFLWTFDGIAAGPFFGEVKPGTRVTVNGAAEYLFGEEGIVSARHVFDFSGVLVRAGVLKVKPA